MFNLFLKENLKVWKYSASSNKFKCKECLWLQWGTKNFCNYPFGKTPSPNVKCQMQWIWSSLHIVNFLRHSRWRLNVSFTGGWRKLCWTKILLLEDDFKTTHSNKIYCFLEANRTQQILCQNHFKVQIFIHSLLQWYHRLRRM